MSEDIQIEQHAFRNLGDDGDLFELTHLTVDDLDEINSLIALSVVPATERIKLLQRKIKKLMFIVDRRLAS